LMARCKAFLFPGLEDFGITPVQAQAAGRPVIAFGGGGALDTVLPGKTGEHFAEMTVESLAHVMQTFDPLRYDHRFMRQHALQFDTQLFNKQITDYVHSVWEARHMAQRNWSIRSF
jgi:glycosyltransferase involved in cell wall biosynthesis